MKKTILICCLTAVLALTGCNSSNKAKDESSNIEQTSTTQTSDVTTYTIEALTFDVPSDWRQKEKNGWYYFYTPENDFMMLQIQDLEYELTEFFFDAYIESFRSGFTESTITHKGTQEINGIKFYNFKLSGILNENENSCELYSTWNAGKLYSFAISSKGTEYKHGDDLQKALTSLKINSSSDENSVNTTSSSSVVNTENVVPAETKSPTLGEKNALKQAKRYLDVSSFSKSGLIDQLEFEGFTTEEATYAVENCNADWKEQAAKTAKRYLKVSSFSKSGLIDQLEFEGFTTEEAAYGVSAVGY